MAVLGPSQPLKGRDGDRDGQSGTAYTLESDMSIVTTIPLRVRSLNEREHPMVKAKRVAQERVVTRLAMAAPCAQYRANPPARLTVTLTRLGPKLMDSDNNVGALKAVRDGVADALSLDDGDPRLTWVYLQDCRRWAQWGVRIELEAHG
jgi:hypothetical protein